jgi:hypothetical protein
MRSAMAPRCFSAYCAFGACRRSRGRRWPSWPLDAGYADQAHMTAEVTALAGVSPVRFLKDRAATAA